MEAVKFYVRVMQTLNSELVERSVAMTNEEKATSQVVKEGVRVHAIQPIVNIFGNIVLKNYQSFHQEDVKNSLFILAQLIDWNDLNHFGEVV